MNIIKVKDLVFLYRKKDENGNITQEIRALDGVDMEV